MTTRKTPYDKILAIKVAVRERDGMKCTACGMTNEEHLATSGDSLHVHRVRPGSLYSVAGCVTLCRHCHGKAARRRDGEIELEDHANRMVRMDPDLHAALKALAAKNDRTLTAELRRACEAHLKRK